MANRTTNDRVQKVIDDFNEDVVAFINDANLIVTEALGTAGLTSGRLELIERYVAAHLWALTKEKGQLASDTIGQTKQSYAGQFGQSLNLTRFGQMAISYDTSGVLSAMGRASQRASFELI